MNPGISEQMLSLRYQELVARGLYEQFVRSVLPPSAGAPTAWTVLKQRLAALPERVRVRLQDEQARPGPWLTPSAVREQAANASSPEPILWLSPYRMP
jgi:hypothetical protein